MQSSPGLVYPSCCHFLGRGCWGEEGGLLEPCRDEATAHLPVLSLLVFRPSSSTLIILEHGLSHVTPHLEDSLAPPGLESKSPLSQLHLQSPPQADLIVFGAYLSQDPLPHPPTLQIPRLIRSNVFPTQKHPPTAYPPHAFPWKPFPSLPTCQDSTSSTIFSSEKPAQMARAE